MSGFPLYDRLLEKYRVVKYKDYNMSEETNKLNTILRNCDLQDRVAIGKAIYYLICAHERNNMIVHCNMGGTLLPFSSGIKYNITSLPPVLQQMIVILTNELIEGSCPESL